MKHHTFFLFHDSWIASCHWQRLLDRLLSLTKTLGSTASTIGCYRQWMPLCLCLTHSVPSRAVLSRSLFPSRTLPERGKHLPPDKWVYSMFHDRERCTPSFPTDEREGLVQSYPRDRWYLPPEEVEPCLLMSILSHVNNWRVILSSTDWIDNLILWWGCWPGRCGQRARMRW